jgi:hypothetical protein
MGRQHLFGGKCRRLRGEIDHLHAMSKVPGCMNKSSIAGMFGCDSPPQIRISFAACTELAGSMTHDLMATARPVLASTAILTALNYVELMPGAIKRYPTYSLDHQIQSLQQCCSGLHALELPVSPPGSERYTLHIRMSLNQSALRVRENEPMSPIHTRSFAESGQQMSAVISSSLIC